jgi:glycogen synthase
VATYQSDPARWRALQHNAMSADYGWGGPARDYAALFGAGQSRLPDLQRAA